MKPYVHDGTCFVWVPDFSVGLGGMNSNAADVCYQQWYYTIAASNSEVPPDRKAIYTAVKITGQCTGKEDDPLCRAILAQQKAINHPILDGKVSPPTGNSGDIRVGDSKALFAVRQAARFAYMFQDVWPRLDKIPGCPSSVMEVVKYSIPLP